VKADGSVELRKFEGRPEKRPPRVPTGQWTVRGSGEIHDALTAAGYERTRTGQSRQAGSEESTTTGIYECESKGKVTVHEDGRWCHEDGHGRVVNGEGLESLSSHLSPKSQSNAASAKGVTPMSLNDFFKAAAEHEHALAAVHQTISNEHSVVSRTYPTNGAAHKSHAALSAAHGQLATAHHNFAETCEKASAQVIDSAGHWGEGGRDTPMAVASNRNASINGADKVARNFWEEFSREDVRKDISGRSSGLPVVRFGRWSIWWDLKRRPKNEN
jgi:hypothetical protein